MGLDMYLGARKYVSGYDFSDAKDRALYQATVAAFGLAPDICPHTPSLTIDVTVAYWRKANAIHKWFVDNCQEGKDECQDSYVDRKQLVQLRDLCKQVLAKPPEEFAAFAEKNLPPEKGFFFGSTDIDEWYKEDLKSTVEQLTKILDNKKLEDFEFIYHASW